MHITWLIGSSALALALFGLAAGCEASAPPDDVSPDTPDASDIATGGGAPGGDVADEGDVTTDGPDRWPCDEPVRVACADGDKPAHATAVETDVAVCPDEDSGAVPPCVWRCDAGFHLVEGACVPVAHGAVEAAWLSTGARKLVREATPALSGEDTTSIVWDGQLGAFTAARNEVIEIALALETGADAAEGVEVRFTGFEQPDGRWIASRDVSDPSGDALFDYTDRPVELFYVRYLQIRGLSLLTWSWDYDERHVPESMRRPWSGDGVATGDWSDRRHADHHHPDIAVPLELEAGFGVAPSSSQLIWIDVYVPRTAAPGAWLGAIEVSENGQVTQTLPVRLDVSDFQLADDTSTGTMLVASDEDIYTRYLGTRFPESIGAEAEATALMDRHFQMAHRHRIDLIGGDFDGNHGVALQWPDRLDGTLFTPARGYDGPGRNHGLNVYTIGVYGAWQSSWDTSSAAAVREMADLYESWFEEHSPDTFRFVYLQDEPSSAGLLQQIDQWAEWIDGAGPGTDLAGMSTVGFSTATQQMPNLDMPCMFATFAGHTPSITAAYDELIVRPDRKTCLYNGFRPGTGTFAIEDDAVALRVTAWAQHKLAIDWHMYWQSTYYDDFQSGAGDTNVFQDARTFGGQSGFDPIVGETGWNYTNGDGVLFYPGTDTVFPDESYGVDGPIASLRLKYWRRGIQDVEYLRLARLADPVATQAIIDAMIPAVLWEVGVEDLGDPSWVLTDVSWSTDPDVWEAARRDLALIIGSH